MEYKLKLKKKKYSSYIEKRKTLPFPILVDNKKIPCVFNGYSVEVFDSSYFGLIHDNGCYGKGSASRSAPDVLKNVKESNSNINLNVSETLVLDLEETFLLSHYVKCLIVSNIKGEPINDFELFVKFCEIKENFIDSLVAYLYLKSNQWIIKSGIKFGGNFLIYKESIRLYHASFVVILESKLAKTTKDMQVIQRVAESADKDVMILKICYPDDLDSENFSEVYKRLTDFKVREVILKRFELNKNYKSY